MQMSFVWLAAFIIFVVIEILTMGLTTIWFAGGALVALLVSLFTPSVVIQGAVFVIVSIILLIFTRPIAMKHFNKKMVPTNVDSIPGETGVVSEDIDNIAAKGVVMLKGMEWTARSLSDDIKIAKDTKVKVIKVEGVKLIVEPMD